MTDEQLIQALSDRFEYTNDNNRDIIADSTFPMAPTADELIVQFAFQYLIAHLARNADPR